MKKIIIGALLLGPTVAFAQALSQFQNLVTSIGQIVDMLVPILITLAVVMFFWGLVKYIANASDETAKEAGKSLMIWGLIAIFIMVALWAILGFVSTQLGIEGNITTGTPPTFNLPN
ncbi:MAG: hypothetical protein Q7S52_03425 [bacterium]|nr:hypothetical protein [bacterium]